MKESLEFQRLPFAGKIAILFLAALAFSYYPLILLGKASGMNIDGSLIYLLAVVLVAATLPILIHQRQRLISQQTTITVSLLLFLGVAFLSCLWTENIERGVVTAGFFLLSAGVSYSFAVLLPQLAARKRLVVAAVAATTTVSVLWALWQLFADATGVSNAYTLLPTAYQSATFGVARPTGFALEPQFFASFLLLPYFLLAKYTATDQNVRRRADILYRLALLLVVTILILTLSRGALYAATAGLVVLFVLEHRHLRRWLIAIGIHGAAALLAALLIFVAASINQQPGISGYESLRKVISHLSLDMLSLPNRPAQPNVPPKLVAPPTTAHISSDSGYVTSSTTSRLSMSEQAVRLWSSSPATMLFGVGIGGFGASLHQVDAAQPVGSVVNNYYLELLVETGLVGACLFLTFVVSLLYKMIRAHNALLASLLVALLLQLCFFSGNANILHFWVVIGVVLGNLFYEHKRHSYLVQ